MKFNMDGKIRDFVCCFFFVFRTNVLEPYTDKDIFIRLPDRRKITSIKWLAIWNLRDHENYGDIFLPEGFEPPAPRKLSELTRQGAGVKSSTVVIMDTKTLYVPHFHFNGENNGKIMFISTNNNNN